MRYSHLCRVFLVMLITLSIGPPARGASKPVVPKAGDRLPEIVLPLPAEEQHRQELGLAAPPAETFTLSTVAADLVVVEIFSMYCPHCQREAPKVNRLHAALLKRPVSAPKIRLLGIGVGNTPMEVAVFRKTYQIPFPLFSDGDFTIHKQLGEVRTPFFFAFRPGDPGPHRIRLAHMGPFEDVAAFVHRLDKLAEETSP
mgnify:CR=1 FL=1